MQRLPTLAWLVALALAAALLSCSPKTAMTPSTPAAPAEPAMPVPTSPPAAVVDMGNPAAEGFDKEGSDPRAIEIADRVMERLGGRGAWDNTRYLTWRFFGGRRHVWDKWTGDHRLEDGDLVVLHNINDRSGRAWAGDVEITDPDTLTNRLEQAYSRWINDAYWLVMPYKLKDSGVTLTYEGEDMTEDGLPAYVLELTFQGVGRTPQNRYQVWVDIDKSLVRQWSFYREAADPEPRFVMPWANWQTHGDILLNDDFGARRHTEVAVLQEVAAEVFSDTKKTLPME